jgi:hypothetical protein
MHISNKNILIVSGFVIQTIDGVTHYENTNFNADLHIKAEKYLENLNNNIFHLKFYKKNTQEVLLEISNYLKTNKIDLVLQLANVPFILPSNLYEEKLKIKNNNLVPFNIKGNINLLKDLANSFKNIEFIGLSYNNSHYNIELQVLNSTNKYLDLINWLNTANASYVDDYFYKNINITQNNILNNKKIVVTAGRTLDVITTNKDALSNFATGTQGVEIAIALANLGANIVLIAGIVEVALPRHPNITIINVKSTMQMYNKVINHLPCFCFISNAAVNDFENTDLQNISIQENEEQILYLKPTIDILKSVGNHNTNRPNLVIGFAAETDEGNIKKYASTKLVSKNCNLIVANMVGSIIKRIGVANNKVFFITHNNIADYGIITKQEVGKLIGEYIIKNI